MYCWPLADRLQGQNTLQIIGEAVTDRKKRSQWLEEIQFRGVRGKL